MTNIAANWPGMRGIAMTSPAEICDMAQDVVAIRDAKARTAALREIAAKHSRHVAKLVKQQAQRIISGESA